MAAFNFDTSVSGGSRFKKLVSKTVRYFAGATYLYGPSGDAAIEEIVEERFTTTGASATGTAGLFSANSQILGAGYEIEVAIDTATSFLIGDAVGADADRLFAAQTTYTAGTKKQIAAGSMPGAQYQGATADNVKLTWTGTGAGGVVRVWVHRRRYVTFASV